MKKVLVKLSILALVYVAPWFLGLQDWWKAGYVIFWFFTMPPVGYFTLINPPSFGGEELYAPRSKARDMESARSMSNEMFRRSGGGNGPL